MSYESINRLSELTGFDRRTVKKRLSDLTAKKDGRSLLYESQEAIPAILGLVSQEEYDLNAERARLSYHQANNERLKELQNSGELVRSEEVVATWQSMVAAARAQLLSLPSACAPMAAVEESGIEIEKLIREKIYEALNELAGAGLPKHLGQRVAEGVNDLDTTAKLNTE